ncbi:hypothetical protein K435DRAFT_663533, partial [Dendrothele bispora CBS 962.96]
KSCEKRVEPPETAITAYATGGAYNHGLFWAWICLWIARRQRPFAIVDDYELKQAFKVLNPNAHTYCPTTVSDHIKEIRTFAIPSIKDTLKNYRFLHLSFDGWTAANVLSFLGVSVHWCDEREGELVTVTLDFTP